MNLYTTDGILLYASKDTSLRQTIENAIEDGIILNKVDLHDQDLRNINFDNAIIKKANFSNCDLTGANMSEAILDFSNFSHAQLYNTCIAYSSLKGVDFKYCSFGATDMSESTIDHCTFSGPSTFTLQFKHIRSMNGVQYLHDNIAYSMQNIPVYIQDKKSNISILDQHILIEQKIFSHEKFKKHKKTMNEQDDICVFYNKLIKLSKNRIYT